MLKNSYPFIIAKYRGYLFWDLADGIYIIYVFCFYFYSTCFYHHFFQVSPTVCHLSNKMGHFSFWPLGGWLSLSSCIRLVLIWTSERKKWLDLQGLCEIGYVLCQTLYRARNHYFCEDYKKGRKSHACMWQAEMGFCFQTCALTASPLLSHGVQKDVRDCWKPSEALWQQEGASEVPQVTYIPCSTVSRRKGKVS